MTERYRPAWVEVDLDAIAANAALLRRLVAPAELCAVVKADGYGHGASAVARAALAGGAGSLAVALVEEGVALREAGITAPILLLSEPTAEGIAEAVAQRLTLTCYRLPAVAAIAAAADKHGVVADVEVKVDTGMHRVGASEDEAVAVAMAIAETPGLRLAGLWTHFAVADDPADAFTTLQLQKLGWMRARLAAHNVAVPRVHAANSAGALAHPASRLDLVRCGIALYGYSPVAGAAPIGLAPALSLRARVHLVRSLPAGEATSYGRAYRLPAAGAVAVIPLGYHDGVPRRLFTGGGAVLIGGRRRPIAGTVTMDQLLVDCGSDGDVRPGDEAVLIGAQGGDAIWADAWARWLDTISYEVLCGIGPRVPRRYRGGPGARPAAG